MLPLGKVVRNMSRSRAWTRYQRRRAIRRKAGFLCRRYGRDAVKRWTGGAPGRLSKGKIHCSCWLCSQKSRDTPRMDDRRKEASAMLARKEMLEQGDLRHMACPAGDESDAFGSLGQSGLL